MRPHPQHLPLHRALLPWLLAATLAAGAAVLPARAADSPGVGWRLAAGEADIEHAFALAREEQKPLLLYWGAAWCPPCNQLKATLFNRQDFIERAKGLVAVNLDGDQPGAQKMASRFKVRGYPTMILMNPDGSEITRLPGEVDAPQVMNVLQLGLAGGRPVKAVLADARAGKPLAANEWRMLAFYAWDIDEAQLVPAAERPGLLASLAAACPATEPDAGTRLLLKALADSDDGKGIKPDAALRQKVIGLLANPVASRLQMDALVNYADNITKALAPKPGADRQALVQAFDVALKRLQGDATLSRNDRITALAGRVALARLDQPKDSPRPRMPAALLAEVKAHAARDDREITNGYERQAVIPTGAWVLGEAGLWADSDALLKANLAKSHSPYYLMSQLGSNARKQGRNDDALRWYEQSFDKSEGPATRLQWGQGYLAALVDLAPQDAPRIERVAQQLITEAGQDGNAFHERSARSLQRMGAKLASWNQRGQHADVLGRLRAQLAQVCGKLPAADPQRGTCEGVIKG